MLCEWDPAKNAANVAKHGLDFTDAARLFDLPEHLILEAYDETLNAAGEDRIRSIGPIAQGTLRGSQQLWSVSNGTTARPFASSAHVTPLRLNADATPT